MNNISTENITENLPPYFKNTLKKLPPHVRETFYVLAELKEANAEDVAKKTGRALARESGNLNELERWQLLKRYRDGRKVYFSINYESEGFDSGIKLKDISIGKKFVADKLVKLANDFGYDISKDELINLLKKKNGNQ